MWKINFSKIKEKTLNCYIINLSQKIYRPLIKATYNYYQGLLKYRDKDKFLSIIHNLSSDISNYTKKANKTLLKMEKYILNAFDYNLSNEITEGINNVIKQMKHTA